MFDLMRHRDDPDRFMTELEKFIVFWFGHRQPEYGVSEEKLRDLRLPTPLKRLYAFAGEWPGGTLDSVFTQQDMLLPIEWITTNEGKLCFLIENQGVWRCGTELEGDDPPVWLRWEEKPWVKMCDSLSQFLVTYCLQEAIYSCDYKKTRDSELAGLVEQEDFFKVPVWIDGPFPWLPDEETGNVRPVRYGSFHLIQSQVLASTLLEHAGTMTPYWHESYPDYFEKSYRLRDKEKPPKKSDPHKIIEAKHIPAIIRQNVIEISIRKHQRQADHHSGRAAFYRGLLLDVERELRESRE